MGQGDPPVVRVLTGRTVQFCSRTVQKPEPLLLGGTNPAPYPSTHGFHRVWQDLSGQISSSEFRVFLFMVAFRYPTVNCILFTMVLQCHCLMYWQPFYSKRVERHSLPHPHNEHQWGVNNWWSCILGNLSGTWSHISINKWLAGCISKYASDTPAIASWTVTTYFIYKGVTKYSQVF